MDVIEQLLAAAPRRSKILAKVAVSPSRDRRYVQAVRE